VCGKSHSEVFQIVLILCPPIIHILGIIFQGGDHSGDWYAAWPGGRAHDVSEKFIVFEQCSLSPRTPHTIQEKVDSVIFVQSFVLLFQAPFFEKGLEETHRFD
jgi:hypothetical protein